MFCFAVLSPSWKPQCRPPCHRQMIQMRKLSMMHGSARFASWRNEEFYSYLVATLSLVWSVRHHFQHVPCAGSHSLALSEHSCHENLQQECSTSLEQRASMAMRYGWPAVLPTWLSPAFWTAVISVVCSGPVCPTFEAPISRGHSNQSSTKFAFVQRHEVFYIKTDIRMNVL
jgi:hypothetical protein